MSPLRHPYLDGGRTGLSRITKHLLIHFRSLATNDKPKGLSLTLHGAEYISVAQSLTLMFYCSTTESEPQFTSYENGEVKIEWSTTSGCGMAADDDTKPPPDKTPDAEEVGSGIGWFFLV